MDTLKNQTTRRQFLGASAALATASLLPAGLVGCAAPATKEPAASPAVPSSTFGGVEIGCITYSYRNLPDGLENIVNYCKASGIYSVELMSGDLEKYLGAPENPMMGFMRAAMQQQPAGAPPAGRPPQAGAPAAGAPPAGGGGGFRRPQLTAEQQAAVDQYNEEIKNWRLSLSMDKVADAKKLLDEAGIKAHIVKFSPGRWEDELIDYAFKVAKAMGAKGVSDEIGEEAVNRMAPIAEKNDMYAVFHQHMQFATPGFSYDPFLAVSPAVMMNFDTGHFFGSTGIHPKEILQKYHDRIFSIHIKDKTGPNAEVPNTNQVWGQGEMPLAEVLLLIKQEKWPIFCDIELEYDVKPWSDAVKEVKTCVQYARQILI